MIPRLFQPELAEMLTRFPAVALLGPRQVGKTTLALDLIEGNRKATYLDLELPSDLAKLSDAEDYFSRHEGHLLVLDEIQRKPDLFPILRGVIDAQKTKGKTGGPISSPGISFARFTQTILRELGRKVGFLWN